MLDSLNLWSKSAFEKKLPAWGIQAFAVIANAH